MEHLIIQYLSKYTTITNDLEQAITESASIKSFPKGKILLHEGDISNECYFILKGCVRSYYIRDGKEKTTEFFTEEQFILPNQYGTNIPSDHFLECIEEVVLNISNPNAEKEAFQKYPQLEILYRKMADIIFVNFQKKMDEFRMSSAEQRYIDLTKERPDLLQRVPQHQIASFLGISPESLSRIRKRLLKKK
ncbi:MAG: Crp/Fnr-type transcriptional regulator [Bacteroidetes bacterium]|nr:Crp/Fnr-type transcriptional regulator [Bacteroidota bacterium]